MEGRRESFCPLSRTAALHSFIFVKLEHCHETYLLNIYSSTMYYPHPIQDQAVQNLFDAFS